MTVTELITVHSGETNHTTCVSSLFLSFNIVIRIAIVLILLLEGVSEETANQCGGRKKKICRQEVDVKNKNLEAVTEEKLKAEPRCIVQHPGVGDA